MQDRVELAPRAGKKRPPETPGEGLSIGDQVCGLPALEPRVDSEFTILCSFLSLAEDGALLGKIEKVRVLRNDRREGKKAPLEGHL